MTEEGKKGKFGGKRGPDKAKPNLRSTYNKVSSYFAKYEFLKLFSEKLVHLVNTYYGSERAAQLINIARLGRFDIVNKETFFLPKMFYADDIGAYAFSKNKNNYFDFITELVFQIKKKEYSGNSKVNLTSIIYYLTYFRNDRFLDKFSFVNGLSILAAALYMPNDDSHRPSPFEIKIVPFSFAVEIGEKLGLQKKDLKGYYICLHEFLKQLLKMRTNSRKYAFPKISYVFPIGVNVRKSQISRLSEVLGISEDEVARKVDDIGNLSEDSPELRSIIEDIKIEKEYYKINTDALLRDLKKFEDRKVVYTYGDPYKSLIKDVQGKFKLAPADIQKFSIETEYVEREAFSESFFNTFTQVNITAKSLREVKDLEPFIYAGADFLMASYRMARFMPTTDKNAMTSICMTINLIEVENITEEFIKKIKKLEQKLTSRYNKKFSIVIWYSERAICVKAGREVPTHIRVISDIHADVNKDKNYLYDFGTDYVLNCGDTAGDCMTERDWIRTFIKAGITVPGNHLGYESGSPQLNGEENIGRVNNVIHPFNTKNGQIYFLTGHFISPMSPRKYFSNNILEKDDMIFIGTPLYTDFKLFGEKNMPACMMEAMRCMNDFKYCTTYRKEDNVETVVPFTVEEHAHLFNVCLGYLRNRLKQLREHGNKKPIIIITHHAPTPYSIEKKYQNDPLNAAFASDLRWLIKEYPEIRLWCHGHVHSSFDYLYGNCRVIAEPFGYYFENNNESKDEEDIAKYGKRIAIKDIKSSFSWNYLLKKEINRGRIKVYGQEA